MLKYLLILLIIVAICLFVNNDLTNKKLEANEYENRLNILNLSGSSYSKSRNAIVFNQTEYVLPRQKTCCNNHYEFLDKYTFVKLNQICDLVPIEIACMKKCLEISEDKRIEFNLEVSDRIDEWIEQRLSFQEVICMKIKKEISAHTKQLLSNAMPIELAESENRLSKEEVFQLIKSISGNLGLNQMHSFENEILSNDRQSNELVVNRRGIEILKQMRMLGKLLSEENRNRILGAKAMVLTDKFAKNHRVNQLSHPNQLNQFVRPINHANNFQINRPPHQNWATRNQLNQHVNHQLRPSSLNRKSVVEDDIKESKLNRDIKDEQIANQSTENYQCLKVKLNASFVKHLLNTYPNITIYNAGQQNKLSNEPKDDQSKKQLQNRSIFSFFSSNQKVEQKFEDISSKLIRQFSSSPSHDNIIKLASEVIRNHSTNCHQDYSSDISDLITSNLRLKHLTNDYKQDKSDEINDACNRILKIGGQLSIHLQNCKQSSEMEFMVKHTFNETESGFNYCLDFALRHKIDVGENEKSESSLVPDHEQSASEEKDQLNVTNANEPVEKSESSLVPDHEQSASGEKDQLNVTNANELVEKSESSLVPDHEHLAFDEKDLDALNQSNQLNQLNFSNAIKANANIFDCLNWNNLKLCQSRFVPWFKLIEVEELNQLLDNRTIKFSELNLLKQNVSTMDSVSQSSIAEMNCKEIMLFENCVRENLDDLFAASLENNKSIEVTNSTCQFGLHRLNRVALINSLANKIINQIDQQVSSVCPKLNKILNLEKNSFEKERDFFRANVVKHFSQRFIDAVNDEGCSDSSISFAEFCTKMYSDQLEPSYVQFYKNFELQNYFGKSFVKNDLILPRVCCAERQLARCLVSAANFKCSRNQDRTFELLKIGDLPYCNGLNSKLSMSQCRSILSIKMNKSSSCSRTSLNLLAVSLSVLLIMSLF